jgi:hypothetical protein
LAELGAMMAVQALFVSVNANNKKAIQITTRVIMNTGNPAEWRCKSNQEISRPTFSISRKASRSQDHYCLRTNQARNSQPEDIWDKIMSENCCYIVEFIEVCWTRQKIGELAARRQQVKKICAFFSPRLGALFRKDFTANCFE